MSLGALGQGECEAKSPSTESFDAPGAEVQRTTIAFVFVQDGPNVQLHTLPRRCRRTVLLCAPGGVVHELFLAAVDERVFTGRFSARECRVLGHGVRVCGRHRAHGTDLAAGLLTLRNAHARVAARCSARPVNALV